MKPATVNKNRYNYKLHYQYNLLKIEMNYGNKIKLQINI